MATAPTANARRQARRTRSVLAFSYMTGMASEHAMWRYLGWGGVGWGGVWGAARCGAERSGAVRCGGGTSTPPENARMCVGEEGGVHAAR
jgi:hypothetical protein